LIPCFRIRAIQPRRKFGARQLFERGRADDSSFVTQLFRGESLVDGKRISYDHHLAIVDASTQSKRQSKDKVVYANIPSKQANRNRYNEPSFHLIVFGVLPLLPTRLAAAPLLSRKKFGADAASVYFGSITAAVDE